GTHGGKNAVSAVWAAPSSIALIVEAGGILEVPRTPRHLQFRNDGGPAMTRPPASRLWSPFGIYYGWLVVAAALLMNLASSPMSPFTCSFFLGPMGRDLGWSRGEMSLAITFRLVAAGLTAPILGMLMDRLGSRWMGMVAGTIAGLTVITISYVDQLWML